MKLAVYRSQSWFWLSRDHYQFAVKPVHLEEVAEKHSLPPIHRDVAVSLFQAARAAAYLPL